MYNKKKTFDTDDVLALILKLLLFFGAIAAAIITALKVYEKIQSNRMHSLCDCCDDEYDYCDCEYDCECDCECDCDEDRDFAETVAEVTEKEINPTEE